MSKTNGKHGLPMPRRKPRIAERRKAPKIQITFSPELKTLAEQAYEQNLPSDVWQDLEDTTSVCITLAQTETSPPATSLVLQKLRATLKAINSLEQTIGSDVLERKWHNAEHVHHVFFSKYEFQKEIPGAPLQFLYHSLAAVKAIASVIERGLKIKDHEILAPPTGIWWDFWILGIITIFRRNDLEFGVRKDSDKQSDDSQASSFVKFIEVLQRALPSEFGRSNQSRHALAQSIDRARTRFRPPGHIAWESEPE